MTAFVVRYDFRAPGAAPAARRELFARALDQPGYADSHDHDAIMVSEHHGADDGYLPSPLTVVAAMAARTSRVPLTVSALIAGLYDPVRLAEDIAVIDHLSGGRVSYTLGSATGRRSTPCTAARGPPAAGTSTTAPPPRSSSSSGAAVASSAS